MKHNIKKIPETIKYLKEEKNKKYYPYYGLETYVGGQGSGKTITAQRRVKQLIEKYPKVNLITNVKINGLKVENEEQIKYFSNTEELIKLLKKIDLTETNENGYIIFIDEIHVVLAELFGKTSPIFLMFLSQQRKLSIHFIATSQQFNKMPKFIRDFIIQNGQIIQCKKILWILQINKIVDMESVQENAKGQMEYKKAKIKWWIHTKEDYESYDTFAVISQIKGLMEGEINYDRLPNNNGSITEK